MTPLKYLTLFSIIVPILLFGQEKDGKNNLVPRLKFGIQSRIGLTYRWLKPQSTYSQEIVEERNSREKLSIANGHELVLILYNPRFNWLEFEFDFGFQNINTNGRIKYGYEGEDDSENGSFKKSFFCLDVKTGVNFLLGKSRNKSVIGLSCAYNYSKVRDRRNWTPQISMGYSYSFANSNEIRIQSYFSTQTLNNNYIRRYYYISSYSGPTGSGQNQIPNWSTHQAEEEYYWQAGLKLTFLFNLKNNRN